MRTRLTSYCGICRQHNDRRAKGVDRIRCYFVTLSPAAFFTSLCLTGRVLQLTCSWSLRATRRSAECRSRSPTSRSGSGWAACNIPPLLVIGCRGLATILVIMCGAVPPLSTYVIMAWFIHFFWVRVTKLFQLTVWTSKLRRIRWASRVACMQSVRKLSARKC